MSAVVLRSRVLPPALWTVAVVAAAISIGYWVANPTLPGMPWQNPAELADFRDTIHGPGRYLLAGGNPYDPDLYLAAHPWAQEFDPYAPAWLLLSITLGPLPFQVGATIYMIGGFVVAAVLLRVLLRWTLPAWVHLGVPAGLAWFYVWSPGRYAMQNSGTLLVMLGWVLVLRAVVDGRGPDGTTRPATGVAALGVALSLLKPQFGVPLVVIALAGGRWDAVWRGVVGLAVASTPIVVACSVSAGGFLAFVDSVLRDLAHATSPDSSLGLSSPFSTRIDALGMAARLGLGAAPGWLSICVPIVALLLCVVITRRTRDALLLTAGVTAVILLGFTHNPYDLFVLIVPLCVGFGQLLEGDRLPPTKMVIWLCASLPVLHLQRLTTAVVPGLTLTGAHVVDATALAVVLILCCVACAMPQSDRQAMSSPIRYRASEQGSGAP